LAPSFTLHENVAGSAGLSAGVLTICAHYFSSWQVCGLGQAGLYRGTLLSASFHPFMAAVGLRAMGGWHVVPGTDLFLKGLFEVDMNVVLSQFAYDDKVIWTLPPMSLVLGFVVDFVPWFPRKWETPKSGVGEEP